MGYPVRRYFTESGVPIATLLSMTSNGVTANASMAYVGRDASAAGWTGAAGPALSLVDTGTDNTYQSSSGLSVFNGQCVTCNGFDSFAAGSAVNAGTDDMILELVVETSGIAGTDIFCNLNTSNTTGWAVLGISNTIACYIGTGSGYVNCVTGSLSANTIYHVLILLKFGTAANLHINGTAGGSTANLSGVSTFNATSTSPSIFSGAGNAVFNKRLVWAAMWHAPGLLATSEDNTLATSRKALFGL